MILFFYGEETYQSFHSVQQLKNNFLKKNKTGGGLVEFDCDRECDIAAITQSFGEQNLFAIKKLIIIENIFANTKAPEQKEIIERLKLVNTDVVVFVENGKVRANAVLFKWLNKNADKVKEYKLLEDYALQKWIEKAVKDSNGKINTQATKELILFIGNNLWQLSQEIQKLICYAKDREIVVEDIHDIVHGHINADMFQTVEAIASQNKGLAMTLLRKQIASGDDIFHIFGMYVYQIRTLVSVSSAMNSGLQDKSDIAATLKLHPFVVQKTMAMVHKLSHDKIISMHQELVKIDFDSKIGNRNINTALELFIMNA